MRSERLITQGAICHHVLCLILQSLTLIFRQICNTVPSDKIGLADKTGFFVCGKYTDLAGCYLMEGFIQTLSFFSSRKQEFQWLCHK